MTISNRVPDPLGPMGIRFNAEKKKIGAFHTTDIYSFAMKCCGQASHTGPGKLGGGW